MIRLAHCEKAGTRSDIETFVRKAAAVGAQGTSLQINDDFLRTLSSSDGEAIAKLDSIRSISLNWKNSPADFQLDREAATRFRIQVAHWLHQAASLGARTLALDIESCSSDPACDQWSILVDHLLSLRFEAQRYAVRLALRLSRGSTPFSVSDAFAAMDRINSPWVGLAASWQDLGDGMTFEHSMARLSHRIALIRFDERATAKYLEPMRDALRRTRQNVPVLCPLDFFPE